jgi:hypothetical protein
LKQRPAPEEGAGRSFAADAFLYLLLAARNAETFGQEGCFCLRTAEAIRLAGGNGVIGWGDGEHDGKAAYNCRSRDNQ